MDAEQRKLLEAQIGVLELFYRGGRIVHDKLAGRRIIGAMRSYGWEATYVERAIDELDDNKIVIKRHKIQPYDCNTVICEIMKRRAGKYLDDLRRQIEE